jgi:hypothetical protein
MSHATDGILFSALAVLLFASAWNAVDGQSTAGVQHLCAVLAGFCLSLAVYFLLV